jgi:thioredoxin reductase (NADPH)
MEHFDVIVIGQGYAGLTAAKLAAQHGLRTANFEASCMGGLIVNLNELDPVPQDAEHSGAELASNIAMRNMEAGVTMVSDAVTGVERGADGSWTVDSASEKFTARQVIVASGARLRKLGVPGEEEFLGQGVSECADCDGPLFRGMETVVVGGGDSAFQEALALAQYASKVTMVLRSDGPRARADLLQRAAANSKLVRLSNTRVTAIVGAAGKGVDAVRIQTAGRGEQDLAASGVFIFVGLEPNTGFLPEDLARDSAGALMTSDQRATALPGLWAIGAVRSGYGGLLTDAAADAERVIASFS